MREWTTKVIEKSQEVKDIKELLDRLGKGKLKVIRDLGDHVYMQCGSCGEAFESNPIFEENVVFNKKIRCLVPICPVCENGRPKL